MARRLPFLLVTVGVLVAFGATAQTAAATGPGAAASATGTASAASAASAVGEPTIPTALRNPIAPSAVTDPAANDSPDPWLQFYDGLYYLTYTSGTDIQVRAAPSIGLLATTTPVRVWPLGVDLMLRCCDLWAPEFHLLGGPDGRRWYLYYAADDGDPLSHRIEVLESLGPTPLGPYVFKATLDTGGYAIDPTTFVAADRHQYMLWAALGLGLGAYEDIEIAGMSNPWTIDSAPTLVTRPTYAWESVGAPIDEAPEVLDHDGRLNVFFSASSCRTPSYALGRLTVSEGADLLDPATWANAKVPAPVFESSPAAGVWAPGHNGFFQSPDGTQTWIVYHATDTPVTTPIAAGCDPVRTTRVQPITFARDGTPELGTPISLAQDIPAPSGDRTFELQAEDLPAQVSGGAAPAWTLGPMFVGGAAAVYRAAPGGSAAITIAAPATGVYDLTARVLTGPGQARVQMSLPGVPATPVTTELAAEQPAMGTIVLDGVGLSAGSHTLRFSFLPGEGDGREALTLDEVVLTPAA